MERVANKNARQYVERREDFQGSNLKGETRGNNYIVTSYKWYPLFVFSKGNWYTHENKYSVSTSKQRTQAIPHNVEMKTVSLQELKEMM